MVIEHEAAVFECFISSYHYSIARKLIRGVVMHTAVLGTQWGDEGKGKIIDLLTKEHDIVVRCQGGNNAGHTVVINNQKYPFHLLPSGVLHEDKICVLGNGMVINPLVFFQELNTLKQNTGGRHAKLFISNRAHIITPEQINIDLENGKAIGTTGRGIGPCYADKVSRKGKRFTDLRKVESYDAEIRNALQPLITDTGLFLANAVSEGKKLLFEGAQAIMLDIDFGTYPFVTSSNCTVGGLITGSGVFVKDLFVVGVAKAYTTRVGNGPFVTELLDDTGARIREKGAEYGTTTGRPRRCGWLDTVVLRYAKRVNNIDAIALTKLDVLSGLKEVKICDAYISGSQRATEFPAELEILENAKPEFITLPGWSEDITKCRSFEELPKNARDYVLKIEELAGLKIKFIGVGPGREEIIVR
ncbi:MAG: adenylosuccinate synthetase [Candidatus Woesearchaeota archaeon]